MFKIWNYRCGFKQMNFEGDRATSINVNSSIHWYMWYIYSWTTVAVEQPSNQWV